jgi:predicted nucleic acid-binding protein
VILLDTNVVSAVMARSPDTAVVAWLDRQETLTLFVSAVTVAEIRYGLQILPDGRRRSSLEDRLATFLAEGFSGRVLPFDADAALPYAEIMAARRSAGRPMSVLDGQIAAIARAHRFAVATRNVRDFELCGFEVVNPFELPKPSRWRKR